MTKKVMLSLLNRASDGNELLSILDSFGAEDAPVAVMNEPTLETIEF
jgi:hypothetical protein